MSQLTFWHVFSLFTAEDIWFFCNLSLKFIPPINIWKIYIDFRLFSNFLVEPFLRPLRSNVEGTTSKVCNHFWKFGCQSRKSKTDHRMTKFWFIWLWYLSFISTYTSKPLRNDKKDSLFVCHLEINIVFIPPISWNQPP